MVSCKAASALLSVSVSVCQEHGQFNVSFDVSFTTIVALCFCVCAHAATVISQSGAVLVADIANIIVLVTGFLLSISAPYFL